jgi:hypothetical protein
MSTSFLPKLQLKIRVVSNGTDDSCTTVGPMELIGGVDTLETIVHELRKLLHCHVEGVTSDFTTVVLIDGDHACEVYHYFSDQWLVPMSNMEILKH